MNAIMTLDMADSLDDQPEIANLDQLIARRLEPRVAAIDLEGEYPREFLRSLGEMGGFAGVVSPDYGGNGLGLGHCLRVMDQVARSCLSTAFAVWCQTACQRYLQLSGNDQVKAAFLPDLAGGRLMGRDRLVQHLEGQCRH